jgi:nickel-dependent lactate racemase
MMKLQFEYGSGFMSAVLPDSADVFIPGETVPDPPHIPEGLLAEKTREALRNPAGMPPLRELAHSGAKCVIVFPDRVKGGGQPTSHRKISIPLVLEELYAAGVQKKDILLICSNGLHSKNTEREIRGILGGALFEEFWNSGQIVNHDSEDGERLVDAGQTAVGDPVIMNKYVHDADVAVLIGHTQGNPYGGYSGGYKHCATGITHWKSIASHHVPRVMHNDDFVPVSGGNAMRSKFDEIGMRMEEKMGKKFFCVDAVLDTQARQIDIFAGCAAEIEPLSWESADKRTYVPWAQKKYDILVFGMPRSFHYGDGMGTNPIMLTQALSAQVIRHKRVMSDRCVIICASECDGYFHDELWPYTRKMFEMFGADYMNTLPDLQRYAEYFATDEQFIRQYRFAHAFHPFHGFSMTSCGHLAEKHTSAIYLAGARETGIARAMGFKTRATFEEALEDAKKKFTGGNPAILALPKTFTTGAVHLCLKDEPYAGTRSEALKNAATNHCCVN